MTYQSSEISVQGGQPVELYRFVRGLTRYTWTPNDEPISYNAETYTPITLKRNALEGSGSMARNRLTVEVARDNALASLFAGAPVDEVVTLTIFGLHRGDGEFVTLWKGRLMSVGFTGSWASLVCEPIFTSLRRSGLRARYQSQCRHVLYDQGCKANNQNFRVDGMVNVIAGSQISAVNWGAKPSGWFTGGYARLGDQPRRLIVDHSGETLTLSAPFLSIDLGDTVEAYAGCDHTLSTCNAKFANEDNFGGWPFIPTKNPFGSDPVV